MTWLDNAQIKTAEDKATEAKESARQALKAKRDADLQALSYTVAGKGEIQTRPQDLPNIQMAISKAKNQKWLMKDNKATELTPKEIKDALDSGVLAATQIWNDYITAIDALEN